jgi:hypothetical protein
MNKLPLLKKNSYLKVLVKDNAIWSHLAYSDFSNDVQYILSDYTDISHLKRRLDDYIFMENFWREYFELLQENFGWKMFESLDKNLNRLITFKDENVGLSGVYVYVDDNQSFVTNIFQSISQYSHDIAVRVMNTSYIRKLVGKLSEKLKYQQVIYIDLDFNSFQIHKVDRKKRTSRTDKLPNQYDYEDITQQWSSEIGLIDSIRNHKLRAFLACNLDNQNIQNKWANLILHPVDVLLDPDLIDIVRSFTTVQLLSILNDNRSKLKGIANGSTLLVVGGKIPRLLGKKMTLLTLIDGLELYGDFDVIWDNECKILSYGVSASEGTESSDIVIGKNEVISPVTKVFVPELKSGKVKDKVIFSANITSQDYKTEKVLVLGDTFKFVEIDNRVNKVIVEGKFEKSVYLPNLKDQKIEFISSPKGTQIDTILIDSRLRPIVYGADSYRNKLKINKWLNAD